MRFRSDMALRELGLFSGTVPPCYHHDMNKLLRRRDTRGVYYRRLCFLYGDKQVVFSTIVRMQSLRPSVFGAECICVFRSVFLKHQSTEV